MAIFPRAALIYVCCLIVSPFSAGAQQNQSAPWDQWSISNPTWVEAVKPFRIIGNIYYVGSKGLSSFLITSSGGHILIDGGLPQNADLIARNIQSLGFDVSDIIILLNSHAHFDHSGGLNALKGLSGAQLVASEGDRAALEGGFYLGFENNRNFAAPPVKVDRTVRNNETVHVGSISITATLTPGHTKGCTSWNMSAVEQNTAYEVLFFCGASVAGNNLVPAQYDGIVDDYRRTFEKTREWRPDVLLVNHPFYFNMDEKRAEQVAGNPLAFVDPNEFSALIQSFERAFEQSYKQAVER